MVVVTSNVRRLKTQVPTPRDCTNLNHWHCAHTGRMCATALSTGVNRTSCVAKTQSVWPTQPGQVTPWTDKCLRGNWVPPWSPVSRGKSNAL